MQATYNRESRLITSLTSINFNSQSKLDGATINSQTLLLDLSMHTWVKKTGALTLQQRSWLPLCCCCCAFSFAHNHKVSWL